MADDDPEPYTWTQRILVGVAVLVALAFGLARMSGCPVL